MLMFDVFVHVAQVLCAHICTVHVSAVPYMPMPLHPSITVVHPLPYALPSPSFPLNFVVFPWLRPHRSVVTSSPSFPPSTYAPAHTYLPLDTSIPTLLPVVTVWFTRPLGRTVCYFFIFHVVGAGGYTPSATMVQLPLRRWFNALDIVRPYALFTVGTTSSNPTYVTPYTHPSSYTPSHCPDRYDTAPAYV